MLDIHTHLFWDSYDADREAVIGRARKAGVRQMICVGTSPQDNPQAIAVAEQYADIYASVGLHPHFFSQLTENKKQLTAEIEELKILAEQKKVVAIGECGLDYYTRGEQMTMNSQQKDFQREGFLMQIEIARELRLPLIIHTRPSAGSQDAYEDMFEILYDTKYKIHNTVLHCYQGDTEITKKFLELSNIYFSFSGSITYPVKQSLLGTKDDSAEAVQLVPLERLFIETDCPFLAPQEKRGTRNEPAYVALTAQEISRLKGCSLPELEECLAENWEKVFETNTSR